MTTVGFYWVEFLLSVKPLRLLEKCHQSLQTSNEWQMVEVLGELSLLFRSHNFCEVESG